MVCQHTMEGNSITCCRDSELLSDTLKSGGSYTSMLDRSVLLQSATECFPHRQYTIIDSPPLTWRVDIHLLKVLMEGWGSPILRPEQKDSLSRHVMVAHVWQIWPTFPPFFFTTVCHCFTMLHFKRYTKRYAGTAWLNELWL